MLRLLILLPYIDADSLILRIAKALAARGAEVTLLACTEPDEGSADAVSDFKVSNRFIVLGADVEDAGEALARHVAERGIDVVLMVGAHRLYEWLPRLRERDRSIAVVDLLYNEVGHTIRHFLFARSFDLTLVENRYMRDFVLRDDAKARVEIVGSGVDLTHWKPRPLDPPRVARTVAYVGRMSPEKNPLGFVALCEAWIARLPDATLRFAMYGRGPQQAEVDDRVRESALGDRLTYRGYAPDMVALLQEVDVLVIPSRFDGRPVTLMEANACGTPVLAAPVGGLPEMIQSGANGYLIEPGKDAPIVDVLTSWSRDAVAFETIRRSSRAYAQANFDAEAMHDAYVRALSGARRR